MHSNGRAKLTRHYAFFYKKRKSSRRCLIHKLYLQNLTHHCTTDFERRSDGVSEWIVRSTRDTWLQIHLWIWEKQYSVLFRSKWFALFIYKKVVTNDMESATTTLAQRVGFEPTGDCSHDGFRVHAVMTSSVPLHINLVKLFYTVFIILSILQVIIFCDKIFLLHTMEISYGCYYWLRCG